MCNCNQKRTQYSQSTQSSKVGMVKVKLTENKSMVINGAYTGRAYIFRKLNELVWVDKRDAMSMDVISALHVI